MLCFKSHSFQHQMKQDKVKVYNIKMYINNQQQFKERDKIIFDIRLLSVSLKIKFPCMMFITRDGSTLSKEVDLVVNNGNALNQDCKVFVFDETISIDFQRDNTEEDLTLTVNLKTAKGSTYQAGLIKLKNSQLFQNQAKYTPLKIPVIKSLDSQSFCLIKVQKVRFLDGTSKLNSGTEKNSGISELSHEGQDRQGQSNIQQENDRQKQKKEKKLPIVRNQGDKKFHRKQQQNPKTLPSKNLHIQRITLQEFTSQQQNSLIYQTESQQQQERNSQNNNQNLIKLVTNSGSEVSQPHNKASRLSLDCQFSSKHKNVDFKGSLQKLKSPQQDNLQSTKNYSSSKLNSPSIMNSPAHTNKLNSNPKILLFNQQQHSSHQASDQMIDIKSQQFSTTKNNHLSLSKLATIQPFTPIVLLEKNPTEKVIRKYDSLAGFQVDRSQMGKQQLVRRSMLRVSRNTNAYETKNTRISHLYSHQSLTHHQNLMRASKASYHQQNPFNLSSNCPNCAIFSTQLSEQKVINESLQRKLSLIKLAESQSGYLKQQTLLKQQSIYLLQQKLKQSVSQNLSLQQVNEFYQLEKIKLEKVIEEKEMIIGEVQEELGTVCGEMQKKDRIIWQGEEDLKRVRKEVWDLRKELVEKEELISMKELQEMQLISKHKKELAELCNKLSHQKQGQVQLLIKSSAQLQKQLNQLQQQKILSTKQIKSLTQKLSHQSEQISSLTNQLEIIKKSTISKDLQNEQIQFIKYQKEQMIKRLTSENDKSKIAILELEKQVNELRKNNASFNRDFNQTKEENQTLKQENIKLRMDIIKMTKEKDQIEQHLNLLKLQNQSLKLTNTKLQQSIIHLQQQQSVNSAHQSKFQDSFKQSFSKQAKELHMARQQSKLLREEIQQLKKLKLTLSNQKQSPVMTNSLCLDLSRHSISPYQTPMKSSSISQLHPSQSKQEDSYYRQLLRKKDQQLEGLMRQFEDVKLSLYKMQKQYKMLKQELVMKEDQKKRLIDQMTQEKGRYSRLLTNKNQVEMKNSKLIYQIEQIKEDSTHKFKELNQTIRELEQTIQNNIKQHSQKITLKQKQISSIQSTINVLENTIQETRRQVQKHKKQQKIAKQLVQKGNKQKIALNKEKSTLTQQLASKQSQIQTLKTINESITSKNYQLLTQQQLLNKKHFILEQSIQELKEKEKELKQQLKQKQSLIVALKDQHKKTRLKIKQLAKIMIFHLRQTQKSNEKLTLGIKQWFEKVQSQIPSQLINKFQTYINSQPLKHPTRQLSFSFNNTNGNSITFFKMPSLPKIKIQDDGQMQGENELSNENELSSIIQNNENGQALSPSKVFGSISGLNSQQLQIKDSPSNKDVKEHKKQINPKPNNQSIHCYQDENILLNQSLTNHHLSLNEQNPLIDNSFGNINQLTNNLGAKDKRQNNNCSPIDILKVNQSILVEERVNRDDNVLHIERLELNSRERKNRREFREKEKEKEKQQECLNVKEKQKHHTNYLRPSLLYGFQSLVSFVQDQNNYSQSNNSNFIPNHLNHHYNQNFISYLQNCLCIDQDQEAYKKFLQHSIKAFSPPKKHNQPSSLYSSLSDQNLQNILQSSQTSFSLLPNISTHMNSLQLYIKFMIQQNELLEHQLTQKEAKIQQHSLTIKSLEVQLQNQEIEFNEWMAKMEDNLNHQGQANKSQEYFQLKKEYNLLIKKYRQLQQQIEQALNTIHHLQQKSQHYKSLYQKLQESHQKLQLQLKQKQSQLHQANYQLCIKEQEHQKKEKLLNQKLNLSNNHLMALQSQSIKLDQELIRTRNQYESMLEYGEQEKIFLKERIQMIQHHLQDQTQRRINAQRLDNFEEANRLFEQNQKLKKEIMKLKRQTKMKEVSASVIMKQKDDQIQMWRSMVNKPANQDQITLTSIQNSKGVKHRVNHILHLYDQPLHLYDQPQNYPINEKFKDNIVQSINGESEDFQEKKDKAINFNQLIQNKSFKLSECNDKESIELSQQKSQHNQVKQNTNNIKHKKQLIQPIYPYNSLTSSYQREQIQKTLNNLNPIHKVEEEHTKNQSQLKKQHQSQDGSLQLLKKHKIKRAQTIQVDLEEFKLNQKLPAKSGLYSQDERDFLFIMNQGKQTQGNQPINNGKIQKSIQPPVKLSYCPKNQNTHYYRSPFMEEQIFNEIQKETKQAINPHQLNEMREYAHINTVNSEQQIQLIDPQNTLKQYYPINHFLDEVKSIENQMPASQPLVMRVVRSIQCDQEDTQQMYFQTPQKSQQSENHKVNKNQFVDLENNTNRINDEFKYKSQFDQETQSDKQIDLVRAEFQKILD